MKSPMVTNLPSITDKDSYSDLKVMMSAAGYYLGTSYWDADFQCMMPGSRDSDYFTTRDKAEKALAAIEAMSEEEAATVLRQNP